MSDNEIDLLRNTSSHHSLIIEVKPSGGIAIEMSNVDGDGVSVWLSKTQKPYFIKTFKEVLELLEREITTPNNATDGEI